MRNPLFLAFGVLVLAFTGIAEWRGWTLTRVNELRNVPKTVRDNPGAYRSHYGGFYRYFGGK